MNSFFDSSITLFFFISEYHLYATLFYIIIHSQFTLFYRKTLQLKLERQLFSKLNCLKHLLRHRFLFLLFNLRLYFPKLFHSFQFFLCIIESDMRVHIHCDRYSHSVTRFIMNTPCTEFCFQMMWRIMINRILVLIIRIILSTYKFFPSSYAFFIIST